MTPSIFTKTGAARKEHRVYHVASQFSPPDAPPIAAYPWAFTH